MVMVNSTMKGLGTVAPDFKLVDVVSGKEMSLADFGGWQALLVIFLCAHCPFVKHVAEALGKLTSEYSERGVGMVGIMSNDVSEHPEDAPKPLAQFAAMNGWTFPVLYDESQAVAKAFGAACTPDFFLFDATHKLIYRGQFDSSRPGNSEEITGKDLRAALNAVLSGEPESPDQRPSTGCNIKWKEGNEPEYFLKQS